VRSWDDPILPLVLTRDERACYFAPCLEDLATRLFKEYVEISDDPKSVESIFVKNGFIEYLALVQGTKEGALS